MARFGLSLKVWWRILTDESFADMVRPAYERASLPAIVPPATATVVTPMPALEPKRNDALTLLAVLQREARLVDFLKEPIAGYSNEQIGGAVRDVHRDAGAALDRIFSLQPVTAEPEGSPMPVPAGYDAGRIRLVGNVTGQPPQQGTLRHAGWEAAKVQLPEWSGSEKAARVVAPAEVEL